jgi:hypothetical protein
MATPKLKPPWYRELQLEHDIERYPTVLTRPSYADGESAGALSAEMVRSLGPKEPFYGHYKLEVRTGWSTDVGHADLGFMEIKILRGRPGAMSMMGFGKG